MVYFFLIFCWVRGIRSNVWFSSPDCEIGSVMWSILTGYPSFLADLIPAVSLSQCSICCDANRRCLTQQVFVPGDMIVFFLGLLPSYVISLSPFHVSSFSFSLSHTYSVSHAHACSLTPLLTLSHTHTLPPSTMSVSFQIVPLLYTPDCHFAYLDLLLSPV